MVRDWRAWHEEYDDPDSRLTRRLLVVQRYLSEALDRMPPGPIRAISVCAGEGRDLLGVLAVHPRAGDVTMNSDKLYMLMGCCPVAPWPAEEALLPADRDRRRRRAPGEVGSFAEIERRLYRALG